jgi:hypothetical protein
MFENHDPECDLANFEDTLKSFRLFLAEQGHPINIFWVFRDDLWQRPARLALRFPSQKKNFLLAQKVFNEGQRKGLVNLHAIATTGAAVAATVWFPKFKVEEVQGWDCGVKLSIAEPLPIANLVGSLRWLSFRLQPQFRHYQRYDMCIGTKAWAAA